MSGADDVNVLATTGPLLRVRLVRRVGAGRSEEIFEPFPGMLGDAVAPSDGDCSVGVSTPDDSELVSSIRCERRRGMADCECKNVAGRHATNYMIIRNDLIAQHRWLAGLRPRR